MRQIVKIIKEICKENNIKLQLYSNDNWIMQLVINNENVFIFGYHFQNNNSTAHLICKDKSALSEILNQNGIAAVEHKLYTSPRYIERIGIGGNWKNMIQLLKVHGCLVCKKNDGAGGNDVYKVSNQSQLENAVLELFKTNRTMSISPYYEIEDEYRIIILNGEVELVYRKERPYVVGDGKKTLKQLFIEKYELQRIILDNDINTEEIIPDGVKKGLSWKHNLDKGAVAEIVQNADITTPVNLALAAFHTINISFASVDVIKTSGQYKILEINSGVTMENFAKASDENYQIAKGIYKRALESFACEM